MAIQKSKDGQRCMILSLLEHQLWIPDWKPSPNAPSSSSSSKILSRSSFRSYVNWNLPLLPPAGSAPSAFASGCTLPRRGGTTLRTLPPPAHALTVASPSGPEGISRSADARRAGGPPLAAAGEGRDDEGVGQGLGPGTALPLPSPAVLVGWAAWLAASKAATSGSTSRSRVRRR